MRLSNSAARWVLLFGTWILGTVFLAAAGLKAIDLGPLIQQIARYQLLPQSFEYPAAVALVATEAALGLACLVGFRPTKVLWGMTALLAIFVVVTLVRWNALQGTDCSCFGPIVTGGPGSVVLHGALFGALALALIAIIRKGGVAPPFRGLRIVSGVFAMLLLMFFARPLAADPELARGVPAEDQVRIFLSATCATCLKDADKVQGLSDSGEVPPVRVFIGAAYEQQIEDYFRSGNIRVKYTPMTYSQLARETPRVPKVQLFRAGKMLREWDGSVPSVEEIKGVLASAGRQADDAAAGSGGD